MKDFFIALQKLKKIKFYLLSSHFRMATLLLRPLVFWMVPLKTPKRKYLLEMTKNKTFGRKHRKETSKRNIKKKHQKETSRRNIDTNKTLGRKHRKETLKWNIEKKHQKETSKRKHQKGTSKRNIEKKHQKATLKRNNSYTMTEIEVTSQGKLYNYLFLICFN